MSRNEHFADGIRRARMSRVEPGVYMSQHGHEIRRRSGDSNEYGGVTWDLTYPGDTWPGDTYPTKRAAVEAVEGHIQDNPDKFT